MRQDAPTDKKPLIFITEDEIEMALLLDNLLESHGYETRIAKSGFELMDLIENKTPDLILLDIMLPGMDGFDTLQQVKSHPQAKNVPVVMCTVLNSIEEVEKCCRGGAEGYITKPFEPARMLEKISSYFN